MKPWEQFFADLYLKATLGKRRYVVLPMTFIFFAIPALSGFIESYGKIAKAVSGFFVEEIVYLDLEERDLLDEEEWGLIIHSYPSREEALKARSEFKKDYFNANHLNRDKEPIWQNDILVVRDPRVKPHWVLAIDMYSDDCLATGNPCASEQSLNAGRLEMIESESSAGIRGKPLQRWLSSAKPFKFNKSRFEKTWGRISEL